MTRSFDSLYISGAKLFHSDVFRDSRGSFEIYWDNSISLTDGFDFKPTNAHHSYNTHAGTIRAFHLQLPPYGQSKLVSCVNGRAWDVILDLRPDSPTFKKWQSVELSPSSGLAVYIPSGCAHGFATLEDSTTIAYLIQGDYMPQYSEVVSWSDNTLNVPWPVLNPILSPKDRQSPDLASFLKKIEQMNG